MSIKQILQKKHTKHAVLVFVGVGVLIIGYYTLALNYNKSVTVPKNLTPTPVTSTTNTNLTPANNPLAAKFTYLSTHGNSSCSSSFQDSIATMPPGTRLQGSCCAPMNFETYTEQVKELKKYSTIAEIPPDPYDINAALANNLMAHYNDKLTPDQQKAYDYAMQNSKEKGPCCCQCWRWHVYGGLAKYLIQTYHFTGQQLTEVWNLSDGCGGNS